MAALTHYARIGTTARTVTSATATEITQYTVTWAELTGDGFAAGDDVLIICLAHIGSTNVNDLVSINLGAGTTFAGRALLSNSFARTEPVNGTASHLHNYFYILRHTLVTSENFYFSMATAIPATATVDDYSFIVLRLNDLTENVDYKYATATHSGNAPTSYDTSGASVTIPAGSENWLALANCCWAIDSIDDGLKAFTALQVDGVDRMEIASEGEDLTEQMGHGIIEALVTPANGATIRVRYKNAASGVHDALETKLFILRLGVFQNSDLVKSTSTITHSVLDTYQEFAGFPTFALTTTGDVAFFGQSRHTFSELSKSPYGRLQNNNADIVTSYRATSVRGNGTTDKLPVSFALVANLASDTLDIDFDIAERNDISPTYSATEHSAVVFSFQLASAAAKVSRPILQRQAVHRASRW